MTGHTNTAVYDPTSAAAPHRSPAIPATDGGGQTPADLSQALPPVSSGGWADPGFEGWTRFDPTPFPAWVKGFRVTQLDACERIVDAFDRGVQVVFLDAPTGAGKTLIAEMVRRRVANRAVYAAHALGLQDQFARDFPGAAVLKGRSNYQTQTVAFPEVTAADCTASKDPLECKFCPQVDQCAYRQARKAAMGGRLAVVNTAYMLAEMSGSASGLAGRDLVTVDEADVLEQALMNAIEFSVSPGLAKRLKVKLPSKAAHKPTIAKWLLNDFVQAAERLRRTIRGQGVEQRRERARLTGLIGRAKLVAKDFEDGLWVRDYGLSRGLDLVLKPVKVDTHAPRMLWGKAPRWLLMSATLISTDEMQDSLGLEGLASETVSVPMMFPVENRLIHAVPMALMSAKNKDEAWPEMAAAISTVLVQHPGERVLVHTVSYGLADFLAEHVRPGGREVFVYRGARERERVVEAFKRSDAGVLFAASVDRGFDFAGDEARVVVVAKIPFPYLGDRVVSSRMRLPGGEGWYQVQMVRRLVQMTGRGVRSESDWCTTYILDSAFYQVVLRRSERLFPGWWRDALDTTVTRRDLLG